MKNLSDDVRLVLKNKWTSFPFMMHIINITKNEAKEHLGKQEGFPVLAFVGEPGIGKTPLALEVIGGRENTLNLYRSKTEMNKIFDNRKSEYLLLDDIANLISSTGKDAQGSKIDFATRAGFNGTGPLLLLTAEIAALKKFPDSAIMRVLPIPLGEGVNDENFKKFLTHIQKNEIFKKFMDFINAIPKEYFDFWFKNLQLSFEQFREKYSKRTTINKRTDFVSYYYFSVNILEYVLKEYGQDPLFSYDEFDEMIQFYLTSTIPKYVRATQEEKIEMALERLLNSSELKVQIPEPRECCLRYVEYGCNKKGYYCNYDYDCEEDYVTVYDPYDLVLDPDMDGLVIKEPEYLYHIRPPFKNALHPLLIIECEKLTNLINLMLKEMAKETHSHSGKKNGEMFSLTTDQKLRQDLYRMNRCIAISNGTSGLRYSLSHLGFDVGDIGSVKETRVCILLLKNEELDILTSRSKFKINSLASRVGLCSNTKVPYKIAKTWACPAFYLENIGERNYDIK